MQLRLLGFLAALLFLGTLSTARAQSVSVNRANKTIAVSATDWVSVDAEVAEIHIGYHTFGATKDSAFQENVRVSNQILKALLDAGIPKNAIETRNLEVGRVTRYDQPDAAQKERQFEATQGWVVRVKSDEAQKVVDLAVAAGANQVRSVDWTVAEPLALEAKAASAAVARARKIAEQMAQDLGVKLGELLYSSNMTEEEQLGHRGRSLGGFIAAGERKVPLQLFPSKVTRVASVTLVFAIE